MLRYQLQMLVRALKNSSFFTGYQTLSKTVTGGADQGRSKKPIFRSKLLGTYR